jgi:hypothetical protein
LLENQRFKSTSTWIMSDRQVTDTTGKIMSLLLSCLITY